LTEFSLLFALAGLGWKNVILCGFGKGAGVALYAALMKLIPQPVGICRFEAVEFCKNWRKYVDLPRNWQQISNDFLRRSITIHPSSRFLALKVSAMIFFSPIVPEMQSGLLRTRNRCPAYCYPPS